MATHIDNTYFVNDIYLPTDECPDLQTYIDTFEPEILIKILGYDLYKAYAAAIAGTPDAKWTDLRDGKDYTSGGIYYHWRGFKNTVKSSLIAYYVFYKYTILGMNTNSGLGIKVTNSENSQLTDKRFVQTYAYNKMVDIIAEMDKFILTTNSATANTYPNYYPECIRKVNIFNI